MAYYRLSKIVKMRRNALGVGREAFDADGPTGMTVYRMEEGKHKASERTYRSLTRSMGIEESTYQGILKTKKLGELHATYEISRAMFLDDREKAEEIFERLKEGLDKDDMRNKQHLMEYEARILYRKGELTTEEFEKVLKEILRYRLPKGYDIELFSWPLHVEECSIVFGLNNVLRKEKKHEEQKELAEGLGRLMQQEYMNRESRKLYQILSSIWLADMHGNIGEHRTAIQIDEENILLCEEEEDFRYLADVYYDLFWNYRMLKEQETLTAWEEERCKECLLRAYYINKIRGGLHNRYEQRLRECYPETLQ